MENNINYEELLIQLAEIALQFLDLIEILARRKKKFRRWWSKPHIRQNYLTGYGSYETVFRYFQLNDEEQFVNFCRMNVQEFMYIYDLVRERLIKKSRRPPLPSELRFALALNYLAHGDSLRKNEYFYRIGLTTVKTVIPEVCQVLCEELAPVFLRFPTQEEFHVIANEFLIDLDFPNCIGALDGRHCSIKKPRNSGSLFFNYKKFFSVVLMACCDSKKRFIWANVGDYGSFNDAAIFANSDLGRSLVQNEIDLPRSKFLPNTESLCPHYLIADGIFPLKKYLIKPFIRNDNLTVPKKIFNYRLSHARRIIENAFGQLSQKWRVNETTMEWKLATTERIITSTICLHNILIDFQLNEVGNRWSNNINNYEVMENVDHQDIEGDILQGYRVRELLCHYLISPAGSVPWQWARI